MNHQLHGLQNLHLGRVTENEDPEGRGRIQVELQATGMQMWALCMSPSAGEGYGQSVLPKKDELVVLGFISPEVPVILGAVWSGSSSHPSEAQSVEDKYALISPKGTKLTMDDSSEPQVKMETSSGHHLTITEASGGEITIEKGSESITLSSSGIRINSSSNVEVQAAQVKVSASMVKVDAAMSNFSGVVKCDTLIATSVVGTSYTPGAGNVW